MIPWRFTLTRVTKNFREYIRSSETDVECTFRVYFLQPIIFGKLISLRQELVKTFFKRKCFISLSIIILTQPNCIGKVQQCTALQLFLFFNKSTPDYNNKLFKLFRSASHCLISSCDSKGVFYKPKTSVDIPSITRGNELVKYVSLTPAGAIR